MSLRHRFAGLLLAGLFAFSLDAAAWDRGAVERFATLPAGAPNPEGIAADRHGNIYASGFAPTDPAGPGKVFVFNPNGALIRVLEPAGSTNALIGMGFTRNGSLLVIDFGASQVLRVDPDSG